MNRVRVRKDNKVLYVPEERLSYYLREGYDQINDRGEVVKRATSGRMISIAEYNRVVEELEKAKALIKQLQEGKPNVDGETVTEETEDSDGEGKRRRRKG